MRERLAELLLARARADQRFVVLSGDHGYALFDPLRQGAPAQFINVGVCEQGMIGYAAGLASTGQRPLVYGLSAFVPLRVLEQIKLDLCHPMHPVVMLGDGAGLVYSNLGTSHQCAEDVAALMPMPGLRIYSPSDEHELALCFAEAVDYAGPSYIRIGKSDRPAAHASTAEAALAPHWVHPAAGAKACLVATGSMVGLCKDLGKELGLAALSVPLLKPLDAGLAGLLAPFGKVITVEEHSLHGGLYSLVCEALVAGRPWALPIVTGLALKEQFAQKVGSWQYALSEHGMDDAQIRARVQAALKD
jgi:transketolase